MQSLPKKRPPRKFFCNFQNCGKSFTRAEHLQRHELNHRDSPNTCTRCSAHFARQDLLERHMERHAKKDKEAGGEGLGVLVTRKRCWRDEDGNITTKRPASSVAAVGKALEAQRLRRGDSSDDDGGSGSGLEGVAGPMSPPSYPLESSSQKHQDEQAISDVDFLQAQDRHCLGVRDHNQNVLSGDLLEVLVAPQQPGYHPNLTMLDVTTTAVDEILASCQADFDDLFSTDTTQSFNMPFTTLNNYNWLFEELRLSGSGPENISISFNQNMSANGVDTAAPMILVYDEDQLLPVPTNEHELHNFDAQSQQQHHQFIQRGPQLEQQINQRSGVVSLEPHEYFPNDPPNIISLASRDSNSCIMNSTTIPQQSSQTPESARPQKQGHVATPMDYSQNSLHSSGSRCSIPEIHRPPQYSLPKIDEVARQQVLELIIQAATSSTTGESEFSWEDPLLSLSALQNYLDLFFSRFNPSHPLIQRQSFDPSSVKTILLVSVLMLGATYGENDAHQMAVRVHDVLRGVLVSVGYPTVLFRIPSSLAA